MDPTKKFEFFTKLVNSLIDKEKKFRDYSLRQAIFAAWSAGGTFTGALIALVAFKLSGNYAVAAALGTTSSGILIPLGLVAASRQWKHILEQLAASSSSLDRKILAGYLFEEKQREIKQMDIAKASKDKLILDEFKKKEAMCAAIDAEMVNASVRAVTSHLPVHKTADQPLVQETQLLSEGPKELSTRKRTTAPKIPTIHNPAERYKELNQELEKPMRLGK